MKFVGNITIFDEEGNAVFERELSADEMIETLLPPPVNAVAAPVAKAPAAKKKKPRYFKNQRGQTERGNEKWEALGKEDAAAEESPREKRRDEIKRLLTSSDLSIVEIAEKCGVSGQTVRNVKSGMIQAGEIAPD